MLTLLKAANRWLSLTMILITHEMDVHQSALNRVAVIDAGWIVEEGRVWSVFSDLQSSITRSLLETIRS